MGMQCLNGVLSLDGTLSTKQKELRTQFFIFAFVGWGAAVCPLVLRSGAQLRNPISVVGTLVTLVGCSIAICAVLCRVPLTTRMVVGPLYVITCGVLLWDLNARALSSQQWPVFVLVINMLLVMQVPTQYSLGLVCFVVTWLLLLGVEESFRFGLFDIPGLAELEGKYGRLYYLEEKIACETPPCPVSFPSPHLLTSVSVFAIDFIVTRGFAREVLKEQTSMERTINTVQEIASLLARYDVEKVAELLKAHEGDLPEGMTDALRRTCGSTVPTSLLRCLRLRLMRTVCSSRQWHRLGLTARQQRLCSQTSVRRRRSGRTHLRGCVLDCRSTML